MEPDRFEGERTLMRIHIGESDRWHGKPLYDAIVELLRAENSAALACCEEWAASVLRAFIIPT